MSVGFSQGRHQKCVLRSCFVCCSYHCAAEWQQNKLPHLCVFFKTGSCLFEVLGTLKKKKTLLNFQAKLRQSKNAKKVEAALSSLWSLNPHLKMEDC